MHRLRSRPCQWMTTAAGAAPSGAHGQRTRSVQPSSTESRAGCTSPRGGRVLRRCQIAASTTAGRLAADGGPARTGPSCPPVHRRLRRATRACRHPVPGCAAAVRNVGNDLLTPGVSAQPGCIACTVMRSGRSCSAHIRASVTCARLARAYATAPREPSGPPARAVTDSGWVYMPPQDTPARATLAWNAAAAAADRSSRTARPPGRPRCVRCPAARLRTPCRGHRHCGSARGSPRAGLPTRRTRRGPHRDSRCRRPDTRLAPRIVGAQSPHTAAVFAASRPRISTVAPATRNARVAARPRPDVAPVITTTRSVRSYWSSRVQ